MGSVQVLLWLPNNIQPFLVIYWWSLYYQQIVFAFRHKARKGIPSCQPVHKIFLTMFSITTANPKITESLHHPLRTTRISIIYFITLPYSKEYGNSFSWTMGWKINTTEKNHVDRLMSRTTKNGFSNLSQIFDIWTQSSVGVFLHIVSSCSNCKSFIAQASIHY